MNVCHYALVLAALIAMVGDCSTPPPAAPPIPAPAPRTATDRDQGEYAQVLELVPFGPAANAGIQVGDVITAVNETDTSEIHLRACLKRFAPGTKVTLTLVRGNREQTAALTLHRSLESATTSDAGMICLYGLPWYQRAAEAGDTEAMLDLGWICATGHGVQRDEAAGLAWYRRAAEAGHLMAMVNVGRLYAAGRGAKRDEPEAFEWYQRAAAKEFAPACFLLGRAYEQGSGVVENPAEANRWYRRAAALGDPDAVIALGLLQMLREADEAAKGGLPAPGRSSPDEQRLLAEKRRAAADLAEVRAEALYWLADAYLKVDNFPKAWRTAKKLTWDYPESKWANAAKWRFTPSREELLRLFEQAQQDEAKSQRK